MPVALMQYFLQKLRNHFYALIYDQWHISARILHYLHEKSGADERYLAIFIISGISIYLIIGDNARFVANTILTAVPILLTYVYPDERPPFNNLLYYWSTYVIVTLFFDPELENKGSYYWMKMFLLILLIAFPGETDKTVSKEHILSVKSNQILSEKHEISTLALQMKPELVPGTESSITSTSDSLIVPDNKLNVFVEKSQTALPVNSESTTERKYQFIQPSEKSQMFPEEKFLESFIIKPEIISTQELPSASQILPPDKLKIKEIPQFTPMKTSQPAPEELDKTIFMKESKVLSERKLQPTCSTKFDITYTKIPRALHKNDSQVILRNESQIRKIQLPSSRKSETTYFKIVQTTNKKGTEELSDALPNESMALPVKKNQIHLEESESTTKKESKISSGSNKEIQEPDIVTATEIQVNHAKEITNIPEKQPLTISDTTIDSKKNDETKTKIFHDISEEKKSFDAITWVATGKTVVRTQNVQTEEVGLLQISN
ncbi:unnamed protein product [Cercopithifilaria johnstoni]|uniref:Uncharacterized protein n=1 Tax=Cercopithifilaria johnstoni TaxID=2874296 RepID=A0A8J2M107_9BILA|nr:unnamed protein product [Cercopithifilaria johnstoni]